MNHQPAEKILLNLFSTDNLIQLDGKFSACVFQNEIFFGATRLGRYIQVPAIIRGWIFLQSRVGVDLRKIFEQIERETCPCC